MRRLAGVVMVAAALVHLALPAPARALQEPSQNAGGEALVRAVYAALAQGDVAGVLAHLDDEVQWGARSQSEAVAALRRVVGKKNLARHLVLLEQDLVVHSLVPKAITSTADGHKVFAEVRMNVSGRKSGKGPISLASMHKWVLNAAGKVAVLDMFEDTAALRNLLALGPTLYDSEAWAHEFDQALLTQNLDACVGLMAPDAKVFGLGPKPVTPARWKLRMQQIIDALPGTFFVTDVVASSDRVVVSYVREGKHLGVFMGVSPTGKDVTFTATVTYVLRSGLATEVTVAADLLSLLEQIGNVKEEL